MRILVCGGRDYPDRAAVYRALDRARRKCGVTVVIQGDAPSGADLFARMWATKRGLPLEGYEADWERHGRAAGPIRNQQMLDDGKPDGVVAFPGGRGTADMVRRADAAGLKIWFPDGRPRT